MKKLLIIILPLILYSCGKILGEEVARVEVNAVSTPENSIGGETTVDLNAGEQIGYWSDMDLDYSDGDSFWWEVEILLDGEPYENMKIDPLDKDLTINATSTNFNGEISTSYSGRNLMTTVEQSGEYTIKSVLYTDSENAVVRKAELVLKRH